MKFHLLAPSKTFLLGEYVALQGGPTLVLTSQPTFSLNVKSTSTKSPVIFEQIDKESPAGKYLLHYADVFKGYHLAFNDPHQGSGGFGASTAQFLLVNTLKKVINNFSLQVDCRVNELLADYHQFAWDGTGLMPSGADLIAQAQGNISYFYKKQNRLQKIAWPFIDINYYLLHTGNKIATHQHLKELSFLNTHELIDIVFAGLQHLQTNNSQGFINCIKQYAQVLAEFGLVFNKTTELLNVINRRSEVLAAKGCGALGADVILVLVEAKNHQQFIGWLQQQKINLVAHGNQTSTGLQVTTEATVSL
jgi:mevalonate kinase